MKRNLDIRLIIVGILVHLVIFYSIFDVYFKSPLVNGMAPIEKSPEQTSPARRLCLFVADGLRSDSFFNLINQNQHLFLRFAKKWPFFIF